MNFEVVLVSFAVYMLLWEKLPEWGTWFNWIIDHLPRPLKYLYSAWHCPYCFGFWAALTGHLLTNIATLPNMMNAMAALGIGGEIAGYFLDALASAVLILVAKLIVSGLGWPAIQGEKAKAEFFNDNP